VGRANFLEISIGVARRDCGRHRPRRVKREGTPRLDFDPSLMLRYPGWVITSGAELLAIASWTTRSRVVLLAWVRAGTRRCLRLWSRAPIVGPTAAHRWRLSCYLGAYADANGCLVAAPLPLCCCSARGRISAPSGRGSRKPRQGMHPPRFSSISSCLPSATAGQAPCQVLGGKEGWHPCERTRAHLQ
jgi:hypothetical protein